MGIRIVSMWDDDERGGREETADRLARRLDQRVRTYVGRLDDDLLDFLEYEEEFETFERFHTKKLGRR